MNILSEEEIQKIGFKEVGKNILISKDARFYRPEEMSFGDNIKIDDFCVLCGEINFGNNIHIACGTKLLGPIMLYNNISISFNCSILGKTDDFYGYESGPFSSNRNIIENKVIIQSNCIVGASTVILPGSNLGRGVSIGACSLVNYYCWEDSVYAGIPVKRIRTKYV